MTCRMVYSICIACQCFDPLVQCSVVAMEFILSLMGLTATYCCSKTLMESKIAFKDSTCMHDSGASSAEADSETCTLRGGHLCLKLHCKNTASRARVGTSPLPHVTPSRMKQHRLAHVFSEIQELLTDAHTLSHEVSPGTFPEGPLIHHARKKSRALAAWHAHLYDLCKD